MKKLLLLLLLASPLVAQKTLLSGTLNNPDGSGFNGQLIMSLAQQSAISSAYSCGGPVFVPSTVQVIIKLVNGAMINPPHIYGSDCTLPYGVPYNVIAKDNNGNIDFTAEWLPIGVNQNIGNIQSVVNPLGTLFGLSLSSIALTGAQNVFTQNNTFQQNVSIGGSLTVQGPIYSPINGELILQGNGGTIDLVVKNTAGTILATFFDSGLVQINDGPFQTVGVVNANGGYLVNSSGGINGQCLVSNGSAFIPGSCNATQQTLYYQHVDYTGGGFPQRGNLNFTQQFGMTDSVVNNWTTIDLAVSGVTAGTYTNPSSIVVDTYGRVTSITSGGGSAQIIKAVRVTSGICSVPNAANASCYTPITWSTPFPPGDVYVPVCTASTPTNTQLTGVWIDSSSISPTGFNFYMGNGSANGAFPFTVSAIYCIGVG